MNDTEFKKFHVPAQYVFAMRAVEMTGAPRAYALALVGNEIGFDAANCDVTEHPPSANDGWPSLTVYARPLNLGEQIPLPVYPTPGLAVQHHTDDYDTEHVETQGSIAEWADATFGRSSSRHVALRAAKEMHELLEAAEFDEEDAMIEEAADVIIVLMRVFQNQGVDYRDVIDRKMRKNRSRVWKLDGTGSGQHTG